MSFEVELEVEGLAELQRNIRKLGEKALKEVEKEIERESGRMLAVAVERAPKGETGQLHRNVQIIPAKVTPEEIRAGFVFLQNYAHIQHERLDFTHRAGQAKYAESAIKDEGRTFVDALGRAVRRGIGS